MLSPATVPHGRVLCVVVIYQHSSAPNRNFPSSSLLDNNILNLPPQTEFAFAIATRCRNVVRTRLPRARFRNEFDNLSFAARKGSAPPNALLMRSRCLEDLDPVSPRLLGVGPANSRRLELSDTFWLCGPPRISSHDSSTPSSRPPRAYSCHGAQSGPRSPRL